MNSRYVGENISLLEDLYYILRNDDILRNRGVVKRVYRILLQNVITTSMHIKTIDALSNLIANLSVDSFMKFKGSGFKTTLAYSRMKRILQQRLAINSFYS